MSKINVGNLLQQSVVAVVFTYLLLVGGTLNGLALYEAVNVSLALLALVGAAWLGWAWWRRKPIACSAPTLAYAAFVAAYALSSLFSLDPRRSLNALVLTLLYFLLWVLVSDLLSRGWPAESFTRVFAVVGTLVIALALWQALRYVQDWWAVSGGQPLLPPIVVRPNPLLTHANMVAAFLNLLWPLVLAALLASRSWPRRLLAGLWILLAWAVILLTSSRGALLGTAAALTVTVGLWWWAGRKAGQRAWRIPRLRLSWRWVAAGLGLLLLLAAVGVVAARLLGNPTHGSGYSSRQLFWAAAWQAFLADPLTGQGPDTFVTAYMRHVSIPPHELYVRAHSQVMHLLAENGLLGILAGGALLAAVAWSGWRRWQAATVPQRRYLAGVVGALAATAVHSFFDTPPAVPVNAILIAVLAAILTTSPRPVVQQRSATLWRLVLTGLLLTLLVAGAWSQTAYRPYLEGLVLADRGDWQAAALSLETAVARDPGHALYAMASATAHGVLASQGDEEAATVAIQRYQAVIAREPGYGLNTANLAALYRQQGDLSAAAATMEQAIAAAPEEATFWLNLGLVYEEGGDQTAAQQAYVQALTLRPGWAEAYFWRANDLRRAARAEWQADQPQPPPDEAAAALDAGQPELALALYDEELASYPPQPLDYLGRGEALLALGRYAEATRDAYLARLLSVIRPSALARSNWLQARIAYEQGDLQTALALAERTLDNLEQQSAFGAPTAGVDIYGWAGFYRLVMRTGALPQLETIRYDDQAVTWIETIGGWYEEAGDLDAARSLYRQALQAAPDTIVAAERLETIGP